MNVVLVCLHNFQEYILTNIQQLIKLQHFNIYVITNQKFIENFVNFSSNIHLIIAENLLPFNFNNLNNTFRNGFWQLTSQRFYYIYEFMKKFNVINVIHLENDVLIYYNCNVLLDKLNQKFMYIPFDTYERNIASIIYIPSAPIFKLILDNYDFNKNDMQNFSNIKHITGLIQNFPIFPQQFASNPEESFVSENSNIFPYIFDAAAIGQYLGGIDPRNSTTPNTVGFVNETCTIKYNKYSFIMNKDKLPFINIQGTEIPIFNLHIHSKILKDFCI